jgi:hypothetical protein
LARNGKLPKAERHLEILNVSEQHAEQINGGSVGAEPVVTTDAPAASASAKPEAIDAAVPAIHPLAAPMISPDHEAPKADAPKIEPGKPEPVKPEQAKSGQAKSESIGLDQIKPDPIKIEPTKVEPIGAVAMDVARAKVAPAKAEAPNPEPAKPESAQAPKLELASRAAGAPLVTNAGSKPEPVGPAPKLETPRTSRLVMAPAARESARTDVRFAQAAAIAAAAARANAKPETSSASAARGDAADRAARAERAESPAAPASPPIARRLLPIAAMLALAIGAGAAGGALATVALLHGSASRTVTAATDPELTASVARIDSDVAALKAGLEQTNQTSLVELNKTAERLDKVEKAQGELAKASKPSELQKLSEAVERLRTAQASAAAAPTTTREASHEATSPREATGSVQPASSQATASAAAGVPAASPATAPGVGRLPVVGGWVLRDVGRGGALIEGRQGLYEVYAGDPVPGLGKVDAIRKQDGRWVVVTTKGLVVAR